MGFDLHDRGAIEKIIEIRIEEIPDIVKVFRNELERKQKQIRNADEFVYGYVFGKIIATFEAHIIERHHREMTQSEVDEMFQIAEKRMREIRDSILNCG